MFKCDICKKEFKKKGGLTTHRKWHDVPENKEFQETTRRKLGNKGENHPLFGTGHTEATKKKISATKTGNTQSNNGSFKKGRIPWNKDLSGYILHSEESKNKISKTMIEKGINQNEKHGQWKGDNASYTAIHFWVERHKQKSDECEMCKSVTRKLELSNIDHKYRRNIDDYRWLCHPCHMGHDAKMRKNKKRGVLL